MSTSTVLISLIACLVCCLTAIAQEKPVDLSGNWRFAMDDKDTGITDQLFNRDLSDTIKLPGSVDEAAKVNNPEKPNLNRLYRPHAFIGVAWYQRDVEIPATWKQKRVRLFLERCHWETRVWLDDRKIGMQDSLVTPHEYDLGEVSPGKHRLTIRVDNRLKYMLGYGPLGPNSFGTGTHMLSEDTQTNWNGIVGRMELRAVDPVRVTRVRVDANPNRTARIRITITNQTGKPAEGAVIVDLIEKQTGGVLFAAAPRFTAEGEETEVTLDAKTDGPIDPWDEFSPALYEAKAQVVGGSDELTATFALRRFERKGTQFAVNGRTIFLRGTVNDCEFPLTGYAPCDIESWRRVFKICKEYGLNSMRFHSWAPPEAAFDAADEAGFYLQVEGPSWVHDIGKKKERDQFIFDEAQRTLRVFGHHPSFCLYTFGNELMGDLNVLDQFQKELMRDGPRQLFSWNTGSVARKRLPSEQFFSGSNSNGKVIRSYGKRDSTMDDYREATQSDPVPLIAHEIGQYMTYPNLAEIPKYTGALKAANFELVRDDLKKKSLLDQAAKFTECSGKQSAMLYRSEVEAALRTPGLAGFAMLTLVDYPGQGTSTIGLLDAFWDSKGVITPEQWRQSCGPVAPLLRIPKRTYRNDEPLRGQLDIANYSNADLSSSPMHWDISDANGTVIASGDASSSNAPMAAISTMGNFATSFEKVKAPTKLTFTCSIKRPAVTNSWEMWVYPAEPAASRPNDLTETSGWKEARAILETGGKTLLVLKPGQFEKSLVLPWETSFWSPVFWGKTELVTYGGIVDAAHPIFADLPTEDFRNWQWKDVIGKGGVAMRLEDLPADFMSIEQPIDNQGRNRRLGDLFEVRCGKGKLIVCGFDLIGAKQDRPAARQLLKSIYAYADSEHFQPKHEVDLATLDKLFEPKREGPSNKSGVKISMVDSEDPQHPASHAIDGETTTFWQTDPKTPANFPVSLVLELPKAVTIKGCRLMQKDDRAQTKEYVISVQAEQLTWIEAARGAFEPGEASKTETFAKPIQSRFLKLEILSNYGHVPVAAIADVEVLTE